MDELLKRPPLISSRVADWKNIQLEHHRQPAHAMAEQSFPFHVIEVGLDYAATEIKVNGHCHQSYAPGNIAIYPAYVPISIESYGEAEFIAIALPPTLLSTITEQPLTSIELIPQLFGQDPLILQMALALRQSLEQHSDRDSFYADSMATALAAHLSQKYTSKPKNETRCTGGLSRHQQQQIIDYIHTHIAHPLSLSVLASIIALSPHHFAILFKQSLGVSPYQYVIQCRIKQAKHLLAHSQLSIVDIAYQVGFRSQSHFTKVFREHTHTTPKKYRSLR